MDDGPCMVCGEGRLLKTVGGPKATARLTCTNCTLDCTTEQYSAWMKVRARPIIEAIAKLDLPPTEFVREAECDAQVLAAVKG